MVFMVTTTIENNKEEFENCLIYLDYEFLAIQEFLDYYYQNLATPRQNLEEFMEWVKEWTNE